MAKTIKQATEHNLPPKKTLKIYPSLSHPTLFRIGYEEGGNVPKELSGEFNRKTLAQEHLDNYLKFKEDNKSYLEFIRDKENAEIEDKAGV